MVSLKEVVTTFGNIDSYNIIGFNDEGHNVVCRVSHPDRPESLVMKLAEAGNSLTKGSDITEGTTSLLTQEKHEGRYDPKEQTKIYSPTGLVGVEMLVNERKILGMLGDHPNISGLEDNGEVIVRIQQKGAKEKEVLLLYNIFLYVNAFKTEHLRSGELSVPAIVEILSGVADAGAYIHSRGVIHGDIKQGNILVDRDSYKSILTDFGIAIYVSDDSMSGRGACGTLGFMSPEQVRDELDHKSDVFSLGATGFYMLTGVPAVEGKKDMDIASRTVSGIIRAYKYPVRKKRPDAPRKLVRLLKEMMAFHSKDRPTMEEVVKELSPMTEKFPVQ